MFKSRFISSGQIRLGAIYKYMAKFQPGLDDIQCNPITLVYIKH